MQREGLKDLDELQSYAVHRVEEFLNARGRKLLGWDEILQGGLAPNAAVMSWRGMSGGRKGGCLGPSVVMTPGSFCYLDKYQGNPSTEPKALEGSLPLAKVYMCEPAPEDMEGRENVLGVQANLWTEYVPTAEHAEYMLYPRMFALCRGGVVRTRTEGITTISTAVHCCASRRRARRGYNTFDQVASERAERPEALKQVKHLALGCP